jgi:16S rRNA (cytosine967-C5)-methyltransferase
MRDGGRIAAALEVLADFDARHVPLKVCLADWGRGARYAGAKDRAFVSGLALDVLRARRSLEARGGDLRGAVALALLEAWGWPAERIAEAFGDEPHGPGSLSEDERALLADPPHPELPPAVAADVPDFVLPLIERVSDRPVEEARAMARRAPVDLRVNALRSDEARVLSALGRYPVEAAPLVHNALRIAVPETEARAPVITNTPAYQKGWVEVQDEASQLAALAVGPCDGAQVLDYCAGGGGKTLAIAALMENTGQVHAFDRDAQRLAPIFERLRRAGARNVQVISPAEDAGKLDALRERMDVVFVDAPCSGSGTWRRRPDTKWRLTEQQLERRMAEQDQVLAEAAAFVRPGGALVYATCSLFAEENEDRIAAFLSRHEGFAMDDARQAVMDTGLAKGPLDPSLQSEGVLRLSPLRTGTDGFSIVRLRKNG